MGTGPGPSAVTRDPRRLRRQWRAVHVVSRWTEEGTEEFGRWAARAFGLKLSDTLFEGSHLGVAFLRRGVMVVRFRMVVVRFRMVRHEGVAVD